MSSLPSLCVCLRACVLYACVYVCVVHAMLMSRHSTLMYAILQELPKLWAVVFGSYTTIP